MSPKKIYFDESGFTGYNLMDPQQPVFAIASTDIEPELAEDLLKKAFPKYQGAEFKFSNITKPTNISGLPYLAANIKEYTKRIHIEVIDKKFIILRKMLDFLVEPLYYHTGYNFVSNGYTWQYANSVFVGLKYVSEVDVYDELIAAYSEFSQAPSKESLKMLASTIKALEQKVSLEVKHYLAEMRQGCDSFDQFNNFETFRKTNDLQLTVMLKILIRWRQQYEQDFIVVHDDSASFARSREMWTALTEMNAPNYLYTLGDKTQVLFPLRVLQTESVDSKQNHSIQLCDIIAGFATLFSKMDPNNKQAEIIQKAWDQGFGNIACTTITFRQDFAKVPPPNRTGPDVVDILGAMMTRKPIN